MAGIETPRGFDDAQCEQLLERGAAYRAWLGALVSLHLLPKRSPHGRLGYRHTIRLARHLAERLPPLRYRP